MRPGGKGAGALLIHAGLLVAQQRPFCPGRTHGSSHCYRAGAWLQAHSPLVTDELPDVLRINRIFKNSSTLKVY